MSKRIITLVKYKLVHQNSFIKNELINKSFKDFVSDCGGVFYGFTNTTYKNKKDWFIVGAISKSGNLFDTRSVVPRNSTVNMYTGETEYLRPNHIIPTNDMKHFSILSIYEESKLEVFPDKNGKYSIDVASDAFHDSIKHHFEKK